MISRSVASAGDLDPSEGDEIRQAISRPRKVDPNKVLALKAQGLTVSQIADALGISGQSVRNVLRADQIHPGQVVKPASPLLPQNRSRVDRNTVLRMASERYTVGQIAQALQVSCNTVRLILREHQARLQHA